MTAIAVQLIPVIQRLDVYTLIRPANSVVVILVRAVVTLIPAAEKREVRRRVQSAAALRRPMTRLVVFLRRVAVGTIR